MTVRRKLQQMNDSEMKACNPRIYQFDEEIVDIEIFYFLFFITI